MKTLKCPSKYITWMKGNSRKCTYIALALITLIGAGLRIHGITKYPTWRDEHLSLIAASGIIAHQSDRFGGRVSTAEDIPYSCDLFSKTTPTTAGEIGQHVQLKNIPAAVLFWDRGNGLAFAIVLHIWILIFGNSDLALRLLPCLLGILAIPTVFLMVKRISESEIAALIASLLVACNALLVQFSQEVRAYSMAIILSLLATYIYIEFCKYWVSKKIALRAILYILVLVVLSFTHYLAMPMLLLAHAVGGLISENRLQALKLLFLAVAVLIVSQSLWMAWGGYLGLQAMSEHDKLWLLDAVNGKYWWLTTFSPSGVMRLLIERTVQYNIPLYQFWSLNKIGHAIALIIFILLTLIGLVAFLIYSPKSRLPGIVVIITISLGGLYSVYLSWRSGHTLPFIDRYYTFLIPYQCMLLGIAISGATSFRIKFIRRTLFIILILSSLFILKANISRSIIQKKKESFSFDEFIVQESKKNIRDKGYISDSVLTALTLGLKSNQTAPWLKIKITNDALQLKRVTYE